MIREPLPSACAGGSAVFSSAAVNTLAESASPSVPGAVAAGAPEEAGVVGKAGADGAVEPV
ncbi:hypothetical protein [Streptomyces sp. NPDC059639]|uniref:hypothetical protein n=1 Tax=Streptomyces sp. NPDC059639 TaxID=3346891 RepID=UPI0036CBF148